MFTKHDIRKCKLNDLLFNLEYFPRQNKGPNQNDYHENDVITQHNAKINDVSSFICRFLNL